LSSFLLSIYQYLFQCGEVLGGGDLEIAVTAFHHRYLGAGHVFAHDAAVIGGLELVIRFTFLQIHLS